jgi:hypothetical protein
MRIPQGKKRTYPLIINPEARKRLQAMVTKGKQPETVARSQKPEAES